jgi:molecular chaperone GrpE
MYLVLSMNDEEKDDDLDDSVLAEEHQGDAIKKLKGRLKEAEEKAKEYLDGWQRERAEIANARKRDGEAMSEFIKFASAGLLEKLVPVLDSFELSLPHGNKELEAIYRQFMQVLGQNGLAEINPSGEVFDPKRHEATGVIAADKSEDDHKILEVMQKGYILHDKIIIRPAKVKIGEYHG